MSRKAIFYLGFFIVLVICFFITISMVLPEFGKPKFPPISLVQPFAFKNQDGVTITQDVLKGRVAVVNFFFTSCRGVCPRMNNNIRAVYDQFKNEPSFLILSHTCDPDIDNMGRLKHYADSMHVNENRWMFLTGRKDSLYEAARLSYKIDDPKNYVVHLKDEFMHTQFVALINKKGQVVRIFDGIKPSEMKQMEDDIRRLLKE